MIEAVGKFLQSPVGMISSRALTGLAALGIGYIGFILGDVQSKQVRNANEIVAVQTTLTGRAADNERFQTEMRTAVQGTQAQISELSEQVEDIAIDAALTRGILEEMRRQNVAKAGLSPTASDGSVVWVR